MLQKINKMLGISISPHLFEGKYDNNLLCYSSDCICNIERVVYRPPLCVESGFGNDIRVSSVKYCTNLNEVLC